MGSGGSGTKTNPDYKPYTVANSDMSSFIGSAGKQYASAYTPGDVYTTDGKSFYNATRNKDATAFLTDYNTWLGTQQQTVQNWNNYAAAVDASKGGQGDATITTGAALGQRQQLLGALAGAGTTTPTPGIGALGAVTKRLGAPK